MFLIQTESNGVCAAKNLIFEDDPSQRLPPITLKNARKKGSKDVWVGLTIEDGVETPILSSLCKSSTDDFLQCESLDCSAMEDGDAKDLKKMIQN